MGGLMASPTIADAAVNEQIESPPAKARKSALKQLIVSLGVWYLYVPHRAMLRMLGPRWAFRVTRLLAWTHWLLTLCGQRTAARRAMDRNRTHFETKLPMRTVMRKYFETKYHHFTALNVAGSGQGRRFIEQTCRELTGKDYFYQARERGKGVMILAFHFGTGRMMTISLTLRYNEQAHEVLFRPEAYSAGTMSWAAKIAYEKSLEADAKTGLGQIYVSPSTPPLAIIRLLRNQGTVAIAGDGFMASQFVDVPFLAGTMRFPTGIARLAAMTGAPIVPLFGLSDSLEDHHVTIHPPIVCEADTPEAIESTMRQCVGLLESYVKRYPWAWWIWHRVKFDRHPDGRPLMYANALLDQVQA
jgi:lauroyl/myristoyl acyltransferase